MGHEKFTAVEWLEKSLITHDKAVNYNLFVFNKAKDMEEEQYESYAEFCIRCDRQGLPILKFKDYIKL
jgi:hypothetical protein